MSDVEIRIVCDHGEGTRSKAKPKVIERFRLDTEDELLEVAAARSAMERHDGGPPDAEAYRLLEEARTMLQEERARLGRLPDGMPTPWWRARSGKHRPIKGHPSRRFSELLGVDTLHVDIHSRLVCPECSENKRANEWQLHRLCELIYAVGLHEKPVPLSKLDQWLPRTTRSE